MILTYSKQRFKPAILKGEKIHTIRVDRADRWHPGRIIHHWMHNPRNKHLGPHQFLVNRCVSIQKIRITNQDEFQVYVDNQQLPLESIEVLAKNDGLDLVELIEWFAPYRGSDDDFQGKIIHWTYFKY